MPQLVLSQLNAARWRQLAKDEVNRRKTCKTNNAGTSPFIVVLDQDKILDSQIQVQFQQDMETLDEHHTRLEENIVQTRWGSTVIRLCQLSVFWEIK